MFVELLLAFRSMRLRNLFQPCPVGLSLQKTGVPATRAELLSPGVLRGLREIAAV